MNIYIITDDPTLGETARMTAVAEGFSCPSSNVLSLQSAVQSLCAEKPDLIVAIMGPVADETLAVIQTIKGQCQAPVVALGKVEDSHWVLRVIHAGVEDYLDVALLSSELKEALGRWKARLTRDRPLGKVVCAIAPSGGCGTSTLLTNLGVKIAQEFGSSLLIDLQLLTDDLSSHLDLNPTYSIADLCQNLGGLDRTLFVRTLTPHASGLHLLAPPRKIADTNAVTAAGVRQALMMGRASFPFVIVDLDLQRDKLVREVLLQSDMILMMLRPDVSSLRNSRRMIEYLEFLGVSLKSIKAILTHAGQPSEVNLAKIEEALRLKVFHVLPSDPKGVNEAGNLGVPLVNHNPKSKYSIGIGDLLAKIKLILDVSPSVTTRPGDATIPPAPAAGSAGKLSLRRIFGMNS